MIDPIVVARKALEEIKKDNNINVYKLFVYCSKKIKKDNNISEQKLISKIVKNKYKFIKKF